jgi:hypothetical protein
MIYSSPAKASEKMEGIAPSFIVEELKNIDYFLKRVWRTLFRPLDKQQLQPANFQLSPSSKKIDQLFAGNELFPVVCVLG